MEHYVSLYVKNQLFNNVKQNDVVPLLECLEAKKFTYAKGEQIFAIDDRAFQLGIILTGQINTVYEDVFGGRSIIDTMTAGQLFCDAFSCSSQQRMPVGVVAQMDSTVLIIEIKKVLTTCANCCGRHQQLTENLIHILADKYISLGKKMIHLSERTTRRKLISYLSDQMRMSGGVPFKITFNQQELADYLFVDRTGLSTEWNRLKKQGILLIKDHMCFLDINSYNTFYSE